MTFLLLKIAQRFCLFHLEYLSLPRHHFPMTSDGQPSSNALPDGVRIVPMAIPGWDASRAADSFRAFAQFVHTQAKAILVRDGRHAEMLFCMPLDGHGHVVLWGSIDRDHQASWIRRHISETYAFGVIHVVEVWMRMAPNPNDHILKQVMAGEIKVSELRPEHRKEALMVSAQSRDGWSMAWSDEIVRGIDGKPSFGTCHAVTDYEGRFGKLFG